MALYLIAISKFRKVDLEDGKPLFESIRAHQGLNLAGKMEGRQLKVDSWYGKLFKLNDAVNDSPDVQVVMLGPFTPRDNAHIVSYFEKFIEVPVGERYDTEAGEVIIYPGGAQMLAKLSDYLAKEDTAPKKHH